MSRAIPRFVLDDNGVRQFVPQQAIRSAPSLLQPKN
jgi:hypothetical protein